jgi:hypothetical protein
MNGKKAKEQRRQEPKKVLEITISGYDDGRLLVNGPLENPFLMVDMLNSAQRVILDRAREQINRAANRTANESQAKETT